MKTSPRGTLVIRPERLGDLVLSIPVLRACRATWPDEPLRVLTDERHASVLDGFHGIDEVLTIPWLGRKRGQHAGWMRIYSLLRSRPQPQRAIILYAGAAGWNWIMTALRVPHVAQIGGTYAALLLGHRMSLRRRSPAAHYADLLMETAALVGARAADRIPQLAVSDAEIDAFLARHPRLAAPGAHVLVHPFRPGTAPGLGEQGYLELLTYLSGRGLNLHLIGVGPAAQSWRRLGREDIDEGLLARLSLRELMAACRVASLVVSDSTGVIHLAAALGTPTFGFYCPSTVTGPATWGPIGGETLTPCSTFCRRCSPHAGTCVGDKGCDLGAGVDLGAAAERIIAMVTGSSVRARG